MTMMFAPSRELPELSRREREVLDHIVRGDTGEQTAAAMGITTRTVEEYIIRIRGKIGARNSAHMSALAVADGLVDARQLSRIAAAAEALGIS